MTIVLNRRLWIAAGALGASVVLASALVTAQTAARLMLPAAHHVTAPAGPVGPVLTQTRPAAGADAQEPGQAAPSTSLGAGRPPAQTAPSGQSAAPVIDRCSVLVGPGPGRALPMCAPGAPQP